MKKLFLLVTYFFVVVGAFALTTPEKINYQGVARNADGELLANQQLGIQIQIRTNTSNGDVVYSEIHTVTTNQYGIFNLQIGGGGVELGAFTNVDWGLETYVELSIDFDGGSNFVSMGTAQLVSVPYAMHAKQADNVFSGDFNDLVNVPLNVSDFVNDAGFITNADDADADATNEIQDLALTGSTLTITNNASATAIDLSTISGANTDEQTLSVAGTDLTISGGNTVSIAGLQDGFEANTDEQTLSVTGTDLTISGGNTVSVASLQDGFEANTDTQLTEAEVDAFAANVGYIKVEVDGDVTNEIQDLSLVGSTLKITNNATATEINLAPFSGTNTDEQTLSLVGTDLSITNGNLVDLSALQDGVDDADADATNEIQQISLIGSTLEISDDASTVDLSSFYDNTDAQTLSLVGTEVSITGGNTIDVVGLQDGFEANTDTQLTEAEVDAFAANVGYIKVEADGDATNEIQDLSLVGSTLKITNNASATEIDLAPFAGTNTDEQTADVFSLSGSTLNLSLSGDGEATKTVDLSSLAGASGSITSSGNVASNAPSNYFTEDFVIGSPQLADDGLSTHDRRFFFDKSKGAFRAGYAPSVTWDDAYVGWSSFATGRNTTASGSYSTAMGNGTDASGDYSTAMGQSTASGDYSTAMGKNTTASGNYSIAMGKNTTAQAQSSLSIGYYNVVSGTTDSEVATDPLFVIGNGTSASRSNALTVLKNGNMGIGVTDPDTDLEIAGQIKITGGVPGNGKVLTSDANGLASWITPAAGGGTDDQTVDMFTLSGTTLNLSLESDGQATKTVNLSSLQDGFEANTDSQVADVFSLTGSTLNLSLSGDGQVTRTVNLSSLQDGTGTDSQTLSISGNDITIAGGNTITIPSGGAGTDDQIVDMFTLSGTTLNLSLESDGQATKTVNLSSLQDGFEANTDTQLNETQVDAFVANNGYLNAEIDGSTTNELQTLSLVGTNLTISSKNTVDLAPLQDGTGTDTQGADVFSFDGSTLSLSLDNDGEATKTVDLSSLAGGGGTDDQTVDEFTLSGTTLNLSLESDGELNKTVDLSSIRTTVDFMSYFGGNLNLQLLGQPLESVDLSALDNSGPLAINSNIISNTNGDIANDDFVIGDSNLSGTGSKMFFDKSKGAFRAGEIGVGSPSWEVGNIGNQSFAFGYNTKASGIQSLAYGYETEATGNLSTAFGNASDATGQYSFSGGYFSVASGSQSFAFGYQSTAGESSAFAVGTESQALGINSFSMGSIVDARGENSFAFGRKVYTSFDNTFVIGTGSNTVSTKLYNTNSNSLLVGFNAVKSLEVTEKKVTIYQTLHMTPLSSAPISATKGDLYAGTNGKLYFYNGTTWKEVSLL